MSTARPGLIPGRSVFNYVKGHLNMTSLRISLDNASARARTAGARGATVKQTTFLASLMETTGKTVKDIGCDGDHTILTSTAASSWIDNLLTVSRSMPKKPVTTNVTGDLRPVIEMLAAARAAGIKHPKICFPGHNVRLSIAGPHARFPGSMNVTTDAGYAMSDFFGRVHTDGRFGAARAITPAVETFLNDLAADPVAIIKASGLSTGSCSFCARTLSDPRSLVVGYGPVCASRYGLPH